MPSQIEVCFKFRIHEGTVIFCWHVGCKKQIPVDQFAWALKRVRTGLQRGIIWCDDCMTSYRTGARTDE